MPRIFLSHSSKDKEYVRRVAQIIGLNHCIVDEYEFESGMKTIDEIFENIEKSDIFVYFISDTSLESRWVKEELNLANDKIENFSERKLQIFPLIIDKSITFSDPRIAEYLKNGSNAYNIRHVLRPEIAARKIRTQAVKLAMERNKQYEERENYFYGRDAEKKKLKEKVDDIMNVENVRCVVVSGIPGIGRKSFANAALKDAGLMEKYYFPMMVSLARDDSIDSLLRYMSNIGIGEYSISDLAAVKSMEDKIELLALMLKEVQDYQELLVIDDCACIIKLTGDVVYWFEKALERINPRLSIIVVSETQLDEHRYRNKKMITHITLKELGKSEALGMLRTYSKIEGIPFEKSDREFLSDCLTGYPPQIKYCVELAKKENIDYVKNNSYLIRSMPEQVSSRLIELSYEGMNKKIVNCILALIASFGNLPVMLMNKIIEVGGSDYRDAFYRLRALSIYYYVGDDREYIKLNSILQSFVERSRFEVLPEVKDIIRENIEKFSKRINDEQYTDELDYAEVNYYVKELLKEEKEVPERFLYGTIFLQSIISLYDNAKYGKVLRIIKKLLEENQLIMYEKEVENRLRYYYCLAQARLQLPEFETSVLFFQNEDANFNFLKGYNCRIRGEFSKAEEFYQKVLRKHPNNMKTRRELVFIYVSNQQYDMAFELAKQNYKYNKNNIHYMQAYFDCLIYKKDRTEAEEKDLEEIADVARSFYKEIKSGNSMCYQILAKYEALFRNNREEAIAYIDAGMEDNKNGNITYLLKERFDIFEHFNNLNGMEDSLKKLKIEIDKQEQVDTRLKNILCGRRALLSAHQGKARISIQLELGLNTTLTEAAKDKIMGNVDKILAGQAIMYEA